MRFVALLVPAVFLAACGSPHSGDKCSQTGFVCEDTASAMECLAGSWTPLPCRGPGGCTVVSGQVTCDMSLDQAGDACASTAEGQGLCGADGGYTLECRSGTLVLTNRCASCAVSNGQVVCQQ